MSRSDSASPVGEMPPLLLALLGHELAAEGGIAAQLVEVRSAGPTVSWFGVNERRVDAVVDAGPDQYRIVYFTDDGVSLESVSVFRRPPFLEPISGGQVVVVNGPSGAGKSSVLTALQKVAGPDGWCSTSP